eukprot:TRINITY_DN11563_c0_g1_i1.p1 TRINITY_DN11563_c0_g1~~TRINITY_DN11563_c0_g1_i1.p1  ORF type:complete len:438 (-),score=83.85 TRINITY_DN11563_c0_g1_i1:45-1358(-)
MKEKSVNTMSGSPDEAERPPFCKIEVREGINWVNMCTFFYSSMASISALAFINAALPYLLVTFLHLKENEGTVTGTVLMWNEIVVILSSSLWGLISDYVGRKPIYVIGFILIGVSLMVHPLVTTVTELVITRVVFALGASASTAMLTSLLGDYPTTATRGRSAGIMGLMSGFGALIGVFVFLRIPSWLDMGARVDGQIMYWIAGGCLLMSASVLFGGLSDIASDHKHSTIFVTIKEGFLAAKNPRIALSYLASFAARGDAILITTFLSLWIQKYHTAHGSTPAEALAASGMVSGIAQTLAIVGAPFFGFGADYMSHTLCQGVAAAFAAAGYLWMFFIAAPTGVNIYLAACVVGVGEIGMIVTSQLLVAAEAPESVRGSVSGFFSLCGSAAILVCSKFGGWLFENWSWTGPFLLVALWNVVVFLCAISLYIYERRQLA